MYVSAIVIFSSYYALMCIILNRLPPQMSFLGGKYLYEKRGNLAVKSLIKLILNHLYRQFCHCYCQKNTSLNIPCLFMFSYGKPNVAIFNSSNLYSVLYYVFNYVFNIQLVFNIQNTIFNIQHDF